MKVMYLTKVERELVSCYLRDVIHDNNDVISRYSNSSKICKELYETCKEVLETENLILKGIIEKLGCFL